MVRQCLAKCEKLNFEDISRGLCKFADQIYLGAWSGVDLRTVQQWLGHSDMESTMRYLKPSRERQGQRDVQLGRHSWIPRITVPYFRMALRTTHARIRGYDVN